MNFLELYAKNKLKIWLFLIIGTPFLVVVGCILFPEIIWKSFLWRYFWGPVIADSKGTTINEISAGYNWVNTTVYGICLLVAAFGIYELINHFHIDLDEKFILSLLPWIVIGGALRSLEDAGLFRESLSPFFISPVIYLVIGISAIVTTVIGAYLKKSKNIRENKLIRFASLLPPLAIYLILDLKFVWILSTILLIALTTFFIIGSKHSWMDEKYLFVSYGCSLLLLLLIYNVYFIINLDKANPLEVIIIPGLAFSITFIVIISGKIVDYLTSKKEVKVINILTSPLNFLIIFSHFFDASATFRGIEYYGYMEKHVLPALFIEYTGTSAVMFLLKLIIVLLILYVMDILYKEEMSKVPILNNLIKFVVIVLGLAPGIRNMLRLAMGV